jgi:hypothetical protein
MTTAEELIRRKPATGVGGGLPVAYPPGGGGGVGIRGPQPTGGLQAGGAGGVGMRTDQIVNAGGLQAGGGFWNPEAKGYSSAGPVVALKTPTTPAPQAPPRNVAPSAYTAEGGGWASAGKSLAGWVPIDRPTSPPPPSTNITPLPGGGYIEESGLRWNPSQAQWEYTQRQTVDPRYGYPGAVGGAGTVDYTSSSGMRLSASQIREAVGLPANQPISQFDVDLAAERRRQLELQEQRQAADIAAQRQELELRRQDAEAQRKLQEERFRELELGQLRLQREQAAARERARQELLQRIDPFISQASQPVAPPPRESAPPPPPPIQLPRRAGAAEMSPEEAEAQRAAYAGARERIGLETQGALRSLMEQLGATGNIGAITEGTARVLGAGQAQIGETNRLLALERARRAGQISDQEYQAAVQAALRQAELEQAYRQMLYQGGLTQRAQDIGLQESAQGRLPAILSLLTQAYGGLY